MTQAPCSRLVLLLPSLLLLALLAPPAAAQDGAPADGWWPEWLDVDTTIRLRYSRLENQFRANPALAEDDQLIFSRTHVDLKADFDGVDARVEIMDSRQALATDSTPLGTDGVNTADVLQAYVDLDLGRLGEGEHRLRLGRETITLGSRRFVHRNGYRNTINAFTGVDWLRTGDEGDVTRAFWLMPVKRRPGDLASLIDNEQAWDTQSDEVQFAGVHHTLPLDESTHAELFVFELRETDPGTRRRRLTTPGFRVLRDPDPGEFGYELEGAHQFGDSRRTAAGPDLNHSAWFGRASVGYRFEDELASHLRLSLDYASGDEDPTDGENERYDTLFGPNRFDFGPTNLWVPFRRNNIVSPELRWDFEPCEDTDALVAYRAVWLEEAKDAWAGTGWVDPTGASGDELGHQLELRLRHDVIPQRLRLEFGGAYLWAGSYVDRLSGGTRGDDSSFVYTQATWRF